MKSKLDAAILLPVIFTITSFLIKIGSSISVNNNTQINKFKVNMNNCDQIKSFYQTHIYIMEQFNTIPLEDPVNSMVK